jgi:hypothetical protein
MTPGINGVSRVSSIGTWLPFVRVSRPLPAVTYDPRLVPVAPTQGAPRSIALTPFWIGSSPDSALTLQLPGVAPRHVALMEREDGFYLAPVT